MTNVKHIHEERHWPEIESNAIPVILSHSIDATFEYCPRKFEFAHVYQIGMTGIAGFAAEVGTALHEAMQCWLLGTAGFGPELEEGLTPEEIGLLALAFHWPYAVEALDKEAKKQSVERRGLGRAIDLFHAITQMQFWDEWELIYLADGSPGIEIPWRINYESLPEFTDPQGRLRFIARQGKIDVLMRHKQTGEIRVIDLKTTVKNLEEMAGAFRFSGQAPQYAMVLGAMMGQNWREDGLSISYLGAIFGSASTHPHCEVLTYHISPEEIEDAIRTMHDRAERIVRYGKQEWWPRRAHGCESFGSVCQYMGICHRRDSSFLNEWLKVSPFFDEQTRIYDPMWELTA